MNSDINKLLHTTTTFISECISTNEVSKPLQYTDVNYKHFDHHNDYFDQVYTGVVN